MKKIDTAVKAVSFFGIYSHLQQIYTAINVLLSCELMAFTAVKAVILQLCIAIALLSFTTVNIWIYSCIFAYTVWQVLWIFIKSSKIGEIQVAIWTNLVHGTWQILISLNVIKCKQNLLIE
jgi:hypothetical protein